jgi:hypothetical protein
MIITGLGSVACQQFTLPTEDGRDSSFRLNGGGRFAACDRGFDPRFATEGGGAEAAKAFDRAGADAGMVIGKPEALARTHRLVLGKQDQAVFFVHFIAAHHGDNLGVAEFAQHPARSARGIVGHQGEGGLAFVDFAIGAVPGHGAFPGDMGAADRQGGVNVVHFAEFDDLGAVLVEGLDPDLRATHFGPLKGQVVRRPLRSPNARTLLEKIHCIHHRFALCVQALLNIGSIISGRST